MTGAFNYVRKQKSRSHANRGKKLESYIDQANSFYATRGQAIITKQHPEIAIQKKFKSPSGSIKIEGYLKRKGPADYIGVVSGRCFSFDAKETSTEKRFDLDLVKDHQIEFLQRMKDQGAFSFLLVRFSKKDESYILPFDKFMHWYNGRLKGGRMSIPYEFFLTDCELIPFGLASPVDYLPVLRKKFL